MVNQVDSNFLPCDWFIILKIMFLLKFDPEWLLYTWYLWAVILKLRGLGVNMGECQSFQTLFDNIKFSFLSHSWCWPFREPILVLTLATVVVQIYIPMRQDIYRYHDTMLLANLIPLWSCCHHISALVKVCLTYHGLYMVQQKLVQDLNVHPLSAHVPTFPIPSIYVVGLFIPSLHVCYRSNWILRTSFKLNFLFFVFSIYFFYEIGICPILE